MNINQCECHKYVISYVKNYCFSGGMNSFQQQPAQQQQQQQQANVQARLSPSGLPPFQQAQLSPRVSQSQQQQQAYTVMSQASTWSQQTNRLSLQQQQNPMLNAQLTVINDDCTIYILYHFCCNSTL